MKTALATPAFATEMRDEELATIHGSRKRVIVIVDGDVVIVIVVRD